MNPVAYMSKNGVLFKELPPEPMDLEPLYTHPAKTLTDSEQDACFNRGYKEGARDILNRQSKTLTEMEILKTCYECGITRNEMISGLIDDDYMITFARAILKKASE